ncbi:hypothetical protein EHF32_10920 [Microbacterium sp. RG1]|nr:hypothetical protein EHF32_10920 [Microbacterium sp. RG1]
MAAFSVALDTAAAIIDPIGTLIANGLGWLLDHIEPLKGWLNDLTGSASEVEAFAQTWSNVAGRMSELSATAMNRLGDLDDLSGATFDAYRAHVTGLSQHLASSGTWAGAVSSGLSMASQMVQLAHDIVRDAISQIVGMAVSAAITAVATLGVGAPAVAVQVGTRVTALTPRIARTVETVVNAMNKLRGMLQKLVNSAKEALRNLFKWGDEGERAAEAAAEVAEAVVDTRPYLKPGARPSFRKDVPETTWENNKGPDGLVRDPNTDEVIDWVPGTPRNGVWDMGHIPDQKYDVVWQRYKDGEMTPAEFRDWYNDPANYRPELPSNNRSHRYE